VSGDARQKRLPNREQWISLGQAVGDFQSGLSLAPCCHQCGPRLVDAGSTHPGPPDRATGNFVMRSKDRANSRHRKGQRWLMPAKSDVELARRKLPIFDPYDTRKLLADARQSSADGSLDEAIDDTYHRHCRTQLAKLLRALGCDPNDANFWRSAFFKLASIHHNVGRLEHRAVRQIRNASSWTPRDEAVLLCGVAALTQLGDSERAAVRSIADSGIFPHHERRPSERLSGQATRNARRDALWQKFQCVRGMAFPYGKSASRSSIEW
jgi:hypothetical protein